MNEAGEAYNRNGYERSGRSVQEKWLSDLDPKVSGMLPLDVN